MKLRLDISAQTGFALGDTVDPRALLEFALATPRRRHARAVERAESRQQALALLLMSPEFQRR